MDKGLGEKIIGVKFKLVKICLFCDRKFVAKNFSYSKP